MSVAFSKHGCGVHCWHAGNEQMNAEYLFAATSQRHGNHIDCADCMCAGALPADLLSCLSQELRLSGRAAPSTQYSPTP